MKYRNLFEKMSVEGDAHWNYVELPDGTRRKMTKEEINNHGLLPSGSTPIQLVSLYPVGINQSGLFPFIFKGKKYLPSDGNSWFTNPNGMKRLAEANRIEPYEDGETIRYVLKLSDSPVTTLTNLWDDTSAPSDKIYAVQTSDKVIQRCILMTTDPGDLVLDPTCGSGTTAFVAEKWGRRWITIDTSRVPLALARQRLLTRTFPYYQLKDEARGPVGGFIYQRKQNKKGEEIGGIIPYISKGSIANNEPANEEVLIDKPEISNKVTRVTGPFTVEATIPTPVDWEGDGLEDSGFPAENYGSFLERMLEVLRRSPILHFCGGNKVTFKNVRPPAKTLTLSAEAFVVEGNDKLVAIVFGPENGAVSEKLVYEAAREANIKGYSHLYVIGFAIQPNARKLIEECEAAVGIPASYCQATPDLMMGDLLKNMRSSQIFSCCGLPEINIFKVSPNKSNDQVAYQVELLGLDIFDPITMEVEHHKGDNVPAWLLDTDYNSLCFHVNQAFFPRTNAWDNLKRALKGEFEDAIWDHLSGTISAPFEIGEHGQIAVKVIDDRGNELMVVKSLQEADE